MSVVVIETNSLFVEEDVWFHVFLNVFSKEEAEDYIIDKKIVDIDITTLQKCKCCDSYHIFEKYEFETKTDALRYIQLIYSYFNSYYIYKKKNIARVYDVKTGKSIKYETLEKLSKKFK